jgi:hypothetical protein
MFWQAAELVTVDATLLQQITRSKFCFSINTKKNIFFFSDMQLEKLSDIADFGKIASSRQCGYSTGDCSFYFPMHRLA